MKYATYPIEDELPVFGEQNAYEIITKTGAYDKKHYLYWYDVCRIEALTQFDNVVGGIALIVSNDYTYWRGPERQSAYSPFSTREENTIGGDLKWGKTQKGEKCEMSGSHPTLHLDGPYYCHWEETEIKELANKRKKKDPDEDRAFRYMMSVISEKSIKQQKQEAEKRKKHNRQND